MNEYVLVAICCIVLFLILLPHAIKSFFETAAEITALIFVVVIIAGMTANIFFAVSTQVIANFVAASFLLMCIGCIISGAQRFFYEN